MKTLGCFINGKHELNNLNEIISVKNPYDEQIKYKVEESSFSQIESALNFGTKKRENTPVNLYFLFKKRVCELFKFFKNCSIQQSKR